MASRRRASRQPGPSLRRPGTRTNSLFWDLKFLYCPCHQVPRIRHSTPPVRAFWWDNPRTDCFPFRFIRSPACREAPGQIWRQPRIFMQSGQRPSPAIARLHGRSSHRGICRRESVSTKVVRRRLHRDFSSPMAIRPRRNPASGLHRSAAGSPFLRCDLSDETRTR